jgi:hypothetical protein
VVGWGFGWQEIRLKKNLNKKHISELNLKRRNPEFLPFFVDHAVIMMASENKCATSVKIK